jgi:hypothetical protein
MSPALELLQARELDVVGRDDQLSATLARDLALLAIRIQLARAFDTQTGLQRAGLVVDAGVNNPRVVARLVGSDLRFALEHAHRRARMAFQ